MTVSTPTSPISPTHSQKPDQASIRAARKRIAELVQNNFTYPPSSCLTDSSLSFEPRSTFPLKDYCVDPERVQCWTEYRFASSDPSSEENEEEEDDEILMKAALAVQDEQGRRTSESQEGLGEGLGSKIRRKRKSLLSHLRPSDHASNSSSVPASPTSPQQNQNVPSTDAAQEDVEDLDSDSNEVVSQGKAVLTAQKKKERKERRRKKLEDERSWNEGLDFWMQRRDAWCCARSVDAGRLDSAMQQTSNTSACGRTQSQTLESSSKQTHPGHDLGTSLPQNALEQLRLSSRSRQSDSPPRSDSNASHPSTEPRTSSPHSSGTALTSPEHSDAHLPTLEQSSSEVIRIPHTTSLLPNNDPARSQMNNARAYNAIYSKVIVQGLTPSVPINLKIVTSALVQGWKQDGEWPPKNVEAAQIVRVTRVAPREQESVMGRSVRRGKEKIKERRAARRIVR